MTADPEREHRVRRSFLDQAGACERLGSPFTARLCRLAAERLKPSSDVARHVLGWPGDPSPNADSVSLRLAGALHSLVLTGADRALRQAYPPLAVDDDTLWNACENASHTHAAVMREWLKFAPQTNEVRRSGALLPGFLTVAQRFGMPLLLSELGASAGLNMHWDRFRYRLGDTGWGDPASAVLVAPDWMGAAPPADVAVPVRARAGCDVNPLDPSNDDDRMRLLSYIWADQTDRLARTRDAIAIAATAPERVDRADAIDWLSRRLAQPAENAVHVVYYTIAWQYFSDEAQARGEALFADAGARATAAAPLARLQFEADGDSPGAGISLQLWPSGEKRLVGRADFHGRWVSWTGWS